MSKLFEIKTALAKLKPELMTKYNVHIIELFGSVVRDDFSAQSDIDIIVDFSKPVGIEFIDLGNYIESKLKMKVDLVSKNGIKERYFKSIESEIVYV